MNINKNKGIYYSKPFEDDMLSARWSENQKEKKTGKSSLYAVKHIVPRNGAYDIISTGATHLMSNVFKMWPSNQNPYSGMM